MGEGGKEAQEWWLILPPSVRSSWVFHYLISAPPVKGTWRCLIERQMVRTAVEYYEGVHWFEFREGGWAGDVM